MEIIKWIVTSSADPQKYSLMVKGVLGMAGAWLLQLTGLTCSALLFCIDATLVQTAIDSVANIVYLALSLISALMFLWGLGRKAWLNRWSAAPVTPADLPR